MTHKTSSDYLENSPPIPLHPPLARLFGVNAALIIQQIRYWMNNYMVAEQSLPEGDRRHWHNGRWWVYNTYEQWQRDNFDFWSKRTIQRHINELENKGVLISGEFNKSSGDRTKWYTINFDVLDKLVSQNEATVNPSSQTVQTISTNCPDHLDKVAPSIYIDTETTTETTTKPSDPNGSGASASAPIFKAIQEHTVNTVFGGNPKMWGKAGDIANWALCQSPKDAWCKMHPDEPFTEYEWLTFLKWYKAKGIAWPSHPDKWNAQAYEFRAVSKTMIAQIAPQTEGDPGIDWDAEARKLGSA
jgi:hypothetical protein